MNQKLRFAFATVITLLAVLWIGYCVFCGCMYLGLDFDFDIWIWHIDAVWTAGIVTLLFCFVLAGCFIGVQFIKATDHKFSKFIVWERIFMFVICPIVFLGAGYFYNQFFTVHSKGDVVKKSFIGSIKKARNIFPEYRRYAEVRIEEYEESIIEEGYVKDNRVHVLKMRLLPVELEELRSQCLVWIDEADKNVTVWNPFLLGNIPYIEKCINEWEEKLQEFSNFKMLDEQDVVYFDADKQYIGATLKGLKDTQKIYSEWHFSIWALLTGLLCYGLLIFVYIIQERNTKNQYTLFTNPRKREEHRNITMSSRPKDDNDRNDNNMVNNRINNKINNRIKNK